MSDTNSTPKNAPKTNKGWREPKRKRNELAIMQIRRVQVQFYFGFQLSNTGIIKHII